MLLSDNPQKQLYPIKLYSKQQPNLILGLEQLFLL